MSPDVAQTVGDTDTSLPTRGADRSSNTIHIAPPRGLFDPARLALYGAIRASQAKVMMKRAWTKAEIYA